MAKHYELYTLKAPYVMETVKQYNLCDCESLIHRAPVTATIGETNL